jgi:HEAT repeat protein
VEPNPSQHLHAAFATGQIDADEAINQAIDLLDAETDPTRESALRTLVAATENRPDRTIDVMDAVDESLRPGRALTPEELAVLRDLARRRPRALSPLVDAFGQALSNPDESEVDTALVSRLLGDVGEEAPGVVKPALGPLLHRTDAERTETVAEASWAVVRTSVKEPAMLRPVIAGRVWDLDSHDPATVASGLETLGRIGWLLPTHLAGLDSVIERVDHPASDVREAALQALGRVAGRKIEPGLGIPGPDRVEPYLERIVDRVTDPDPDVRLTAIATLGQFAREDPGSVSDVLDTLVLATDDDVWYVRAAALETLETAIDPTELDLQTIDLERMQRHILPRLTDGDDDVETAAVSLLVTLVEEFGSERSAFVRHVVDLLVWYEYYCGGMFDGSEPFAALDEAQASLSDVSRYMRVVRALEDSDDDRIRSTTVELCGFVARRSPEHRLTAIDMLQSMLGDEEESVRRRVLTEFETLVETDPAVAHTVGHITSLVFKYDPELRDEAASVLAACHSHESAFLDEAIGLHCQFLREAQKRDDESKDDDSDEGLGELFAGESGQSHLDAFVESAPCLVADAAPKLVECLLADDDSTEFVAESLARAAANGGSIDSQTAQAVENAIHEEASSSSLVAWLSTLLLLGTESDALHDRAVDRLHSLAERDEPTPLPSCLSLLVEHEPALVARLLVVYPPLADLPAGTGFSQTRVELLAEVVSAHPRLFLRCRGRRSPYSDRSLSLGYANDKDWLSELVASVPQTVPAADWLHNGFWADDGEVTARLLETVGRADALHGDDKLETWVVHPHPEVRTVARELRADTAATPSALSSSADELPNSAECTPTNATEEVVDNIATDVAASDPERCRSALEQLISIGVSDSELRAYVRQHLLASSVTVDEVAAPHSLLGALVTLAPRELEPSSARETTAAEGMLPGGPIDAGMRSAVYRQYATFGTTPVRDVALTALCSLPPEAVDASVAETLTERLQDVDDTVRAQAARTVTHFARDPAVVSAVLIDALITGLHGPRHVTIACCEALGQCVAANLSFAERAVPALETRLRARERGVRRAAASALAHIGRTRPDALQPITNTIVERFRSDQVVRSELVPAMASIPVSKMPTPKLIVEPLLAELVETDDPSVSQATGRLLVAIANDSPESVRIHLKDVSERLEEDFEESFVPDFRDVETSALSTYWLLRIVGTCAEDNHLVAKDFEWLVTETIEDLYDEEEDGFGSSVPIYDGQVTTRGLARMAARVAAFGGLDCYESVLERWFVDPSKPEPDPTEVAHHLVVADPKTRTETVVAIDEFAPTSHVDALLEELFEIEINLNRYDAVFESLTKLLPRTDDKRLHRRGVTVLLDASRGRNWKICTAAVETLAELGQTEVVQADEVIAHLIGLFDAGSRADSTVADVVGDLLQYAHLDTETLFVSVLTHYEQSQQSPNRRQTAIRLVGILGRRDPAVRDRAVAALVNAISDDDQWVRKEAARALTDINGVAPDALRPYHDKIETLIETAGDGIAATLETCVTTTSRLD